MNKPIIYLDFDGVINQINPFGIPRTSTGGEYPIDVVKIADTPEGRYRCRWNRSLADGLYTLRDRAELKWLSTWQPFTDVLDRMLDWSPDVVETVRWYDADSKNGIWTGKPDHILSRIRFENTEPEPTPIIWVDDEECIYRAYQRILDADPKSRILMIRPDCRIGVSPRQFELINRFVKNPAGFEEQVTWDVEPSANEVNPDLSVGFRKEH